MCVCQSNDLVDLLQIGVRVVIQLNMAAVRHPSGVSVDIVGIEEGNRGRSCEEHLVCGSVIELDVVLQLRSVQIING